MRYNDFTMKYDALTKEQQIKFNQLNTMNPSWSLGRLFKEARK